MTLYTALVTISKAAAPMIPFMTEDIYRNLVCSIDSSAPESVHLCDFPTVDDKLIDKQLEADMEAAAREQHGQPYCNAQTQWDEHDGRAQCIVVDRLREQREQRQWRQVLRRGRPQGVVGRLTDGESGAEQP